MPARQTDRFALAILLLLAATVLGMVSGYWLWKGKLEAEEHARQAIRERDQARRDYAAAVARLDAVKLRISRQTEQEFERFLAAMDEEIGRFGTGVPNETYTDVLRRMQSLLDNARAELNQITADKQRLEADYAVLEQIKQVAVEQATAASQAARRDLLAERAEFLRQMAGKDGEIAAIMDRANTIAAKLETEQRDKARVREELLREVNQLRKVLEEARAPYTPDALAKQKPDGKVIRASAATRTAWIGIGSRDGAQAQLTFSVQPADFSGNPFVRPKAKLEIVRIVAPDLAEARITESSLTDPVIEGDLIFNPVWNPGKVMRFALAGILDIDDDGQDDRRLVRSIIERAGGRIDAEVLPDGTVHGELTVQTNYLVRGRHALQADDDHLDPKLVAAIARMQRTAIDYGAVVIDLSKFLDLLGYSKPQPLGSPMPSRASSPAYPAPRTTKENPVLRTELTN